MKIDLDSIYRTADKEYEAATEVIEISNAVPTKEYEQCRTIQYLAACLLLIIESIQESQTENEGSAS